MEETEHNCRRVEESLKQNTTNKAVSEGNQRLNKEHTPQFELLFKIVL